jgi:hypothetical protein
VLIGVNLIGVNLIGVNLIGVNDDAKVHAVHRHLLVLNLYLSLKVNRPHAMWAIRTASSERFSHAITSGFAVAGRADAGCRPPLKFVLIHSVPPRSYISGAMRPASMKSSMAAGVLIPSTGSRRTPSGVN